MTLEELRAHLRDLDGRKAEAELNALPQWTTEIDGQTIHFVHVRSERDDAIPLIVLHGWPGTVVELLDLVAPLTAPESDADPAFHVVIPSHPGVGLSGPTTSPGWGVPRTAKAYAALMAELGYGSYVVQGGDHGAVLARTSAASTARMCGVFTSTPPPSGSCPWVKWTREKWPT